MRSLSVYFVSMLCILIAGLRRVYPRVYPVNSRLAALCTLVGCCRLANMAGIWRAGKLEAIL